jgi:hypothetical protein
MLEQSNIIYPKYPTKIVNFFIFKIKNRLLDILEFKKRKKRDLIRQEIREKRLNKKNTEEEKENIL